MLLETFIPQCEARFIPVEYFDLIALFITEDEQRIAKRIEVHFLLNHDNQAVNRFTEVDNIHVQIDICRLNEHLHSTNALITVATQ